MSGASGIQGYLVQTISCLIDVLCDETSWTSVTLEPDNASEKVDILWQYTDRTKVVQVKSSRNQLSLSIVQSWCTELRKSVAADEYELILIGPSSQSVIELVKYDDVQIPTPLNLNINGLVEQAAHRLAKYLHKINTQQMPPLTREILVHAMISKLAEYSTQSKPLSRSDLELLIINWMQSIDLSNSFEKRYTSDKDRPIETWKTNLWAIQYVNVPRILAALALQSEITTYNGYDLQTVTTLRDADFSQYHGIIGTVREILKIWKPDTLSLGLGGKLKTESIGARIGFKQIQFRSKGMPSWKIVQSGKHSLTGDINKDPHLYYMNGDQKVYLPIDTSWITTGTAYGDFKYSGSYTSLLTGFGILKYSCNEFAVITPLILGIPDYMGMMGMPETWV